MSVFKPDSGAIGGVSSAVRINSYLLEELNTTCYTYH